MGMQTDFKIAQFREDNGINIPTGEHRAMLERLRKEAHELLEIITMELTGIRDGDGHWYGSYPTSGLVEDMVGIIRPEAIVVDREIWELLNASDDEIALTAAKSKTDTLWTSFAEHREDAFREHFSLLEIVEKIASPAMAEIAAEQGQKVTDALNGMYEVEQRMSTTLPPHKMPARKPWDAPAAA